MTIVRMRVIDPVTGAPTSVEHTPADTLAEAREGLLNIGPEWARQSGHFGLFAKGPNCTCTICHIDRMIAALGGSEEPTIPERPPSESPGR